MIYCIWYPSGGFGNFVNAILSLFGKDFVRPEIIDYEFTNNGSSHNFPRSLPSYKNSIEFTSVIDTSKNISILIDNGITDEGKEFYSKFPNSVKIKLCYSNISWPVVAQTSIIKAMNSSLEVEFAVNQNKWDTLEDWVIREKYFLSLRDHSFRGAWKEDSDCICIYVEEMRQYELFKSKLESAGIVLDDFRPLWQRWYDTNDHYFKPIEQAHSIINALQSNNNFSLSHITNIWEQAVIYYLLWLNYQQEIPHYDYANFFNEVNDIKIWLNSVGILK